MVVGTSLTLDGVMQASGGSGKDRDGGFELGGWAVNSWDDRMFELDMEQIVEGDALPHDFRTTT